MSQVKYILKKRSPNSGTIESYGNTLICGEVENLYDAQKWVKENTDVFHEAWFDIFMEHIEGKEGMSQ